MLADPLANRRSDFRLADKTATASVTIFLGGYPVEITAPGKGHTLGNLVVYFPRQQAIAPGDHFMHGSSPAMDKRNVENWIKNAGRCAGETVATHRPRPF